MSNMRLSVAGIKMKSLHEWTYQSEVQRFKTRKLLTPEAAKTRQLRNISQNRMESAASSNYNILVADGVSF